MKPESLRPRYLLVYIAGAGHCGSTLLNLLLNGHSRVLGLSEVSTLPDHIRRRDELLEQPFWRNVARRYEESTGLSFPDLETAGPPALRILSSGDRRVEEWARPNRVLLDCIARESGASALVDASKSWQRLTMLQRSCDFDLRVIHLIRDGRAVYNSYRRKYRRGLFTLTKWPKFTLSALLLKRSFSTATWLDLRYEALASDPETAWPRCAISSPSTSNRQCSGIGNRKI